MRKAGGGALRVIVHVPGARAIARRLLARHPALKQKLVDVALARYVKKEGEEQAAGETTVPGQPAQVLSRSTREALTLIKAYRKQGR
jgi:hypothetical protein